MIALRYDEDDEELCCSAKQRQMNNEGNEDDEGDLAHKASGTVALYIYHVGRLLSEGSNYVCMKIFFTCLQGSAYCTILIPSAMLAVLRVHHAVRGKYRSLTLNAGCWMLDLDVGQDRHCSFRQPPA